MFLFCFESTHQTANIISMRSSVLPRTQNEYLLYSLNMISLMMLAGLILNNHTIIFFGTFTESLRVIMGNRVDDI